MRLPATIAVCLLAAGALAGCDRPEARLRPIFAAAGNPAQGRGAAAQDLAQQIIAGRLTIADAIDDAVARIDAAAAAGRPSTNETIYAGAVLDAAAIAEDSLPQGGEFEFLWIKLGRLAFIAAEEAHAHDRVAEAMTIVLAGPQRWQTEPYWLRYSDHDALAAVVLAKSGRAPEAVLRLQSRTVLDGPALEVYQMLTGTGGG
jgi:hypothetical protein